MASSLSRMTAVCVLPIHATAHNSCPLGAISDKFKSSHEKLYPLNT